MASTTTINITINNGVPPFETWYTMSQAAKMTGKLGRNKLYAFLREQEILMSNNEPYQTYCTQGYFKLEQVPKYDRWGQLHQYFSVLFASPKGVEFITKLLDKKQP